MANDSSRLISLATPASDEVTVYVKGFLGSGEDPEHFESWHRGHRALVESRGWGAGAHGWGWSSGSWFTVPVPVASGAKLAVDVYRAVRYARVAALGATVGLAVAEIGARFLAQYLAAERRAAADAEALAEELDRLAAEHRYVRVVAHSLGCRQVVEAAARLPASRRPSEVHLCAPALVERDVAHLLPNLAERSYVYYSPKDLVLSLAFPIVAWERPLGVVPPEAEYASLTAIDVTEHFGFRVHGEYKNRFAAFAATPLSTMRAAAPCNG